VGSPLVPGTDFGALVVGVLGVLVAWVVVLSTAAAVLLKRRDV